MYRNKYACRITKNVPLRISFDRTDFSDRNVRTGSRYGSMIKRFQGTVW